MASPTTRKQRLWRVLRALLVTLFATAAAVVMFGTIALSTWNF